VSTSESPSSESCWISPHHTASEVHRHDGPHAGQVQETIGNDETERSTTVIVEVGLGTLVVGVLLVIGAQGGHTVEDVKGMPKPKPANAHRSATRCIGCIFVSAVGVAVRNYDELYSSWQPYNDRSMSTNIIDRPLTCQMTSPS